MHPQKRYVIRDGTVCTGHERRGEIVDVRPARISFEWSPPAAAPDATKVTTDPVGCTLTVIICPQKGVSLPPLRAPGRFERSYSYYSPVFGQKSPFDGGEVRTRIFAVNIRFTVLDTEMHRPGSYICLGSCSGIPDQRHYDEQRESYRAQLAHQHEAHQASVRQAEKERRDREAEEARQRDLDEEHQATLLARVAEARVDHGRWSQLCLWARGKQGAKNFAIEWRRREDRPLSAEIIAMLKAEIHRLRKLQPTP